MYYQIDQAVLDIRPGCCYSIDAGNAGEENSPVNCFPRPGRRAIKTAAADTLARFSFGLGNQKRPGNKLGFRFLGRSPAVFFV